MNAECVAPKPAAVVAALDPLVAEGNPYAALWSARLLATPDSAEQQRIVAELTEVMRQAAQVISTAWSQLARAFCVSTTDLGAYLSALTAVDSQPFDEFPDDCWRCDTTAATTDVGLCADCFSALETP